MAYLNRQYYQEGLAQLNEVVKLAPENRALLKQGMLLNKYMQSAGLLPSAVQQTNLGTSTKAKILIVEDSAVTRKVIARTLIASGYEVFEAKNAEEALTDIVERNYDMVLLDIILPDRDGYEILAEIRQTRPIAKVPVVMLTSRDSLFDKLKGKVSDANEYLTKPFQPDELLLVVKKYLK
jgi:CheY-like chemotaxis protein